MFCFQCEQTANGTGCTKGGVCGKSPEVAALQDLLLYELKGLALVALEAEKVGILDDAVDRFTIEALFSTLTNVDFDPDRFVVLLNQGAKLREQLAEKVGKAGGKVDLSDDAARFQPAATLEGLIAQGEKVGVKSDPQADPDVSALKELLIYGMKGVAAYADHARILGKTDAAISRFL